MFDEKEVFAIVMESEPGGELLDKVVKVYENETFMVEEIIECKCSGWKKGNKMFKCEQNNVNLCSLAVLVRK